MTQIQIDGQSYNMAYNLRTAIAYEQMTGNNPLDLEHFNKNQFTNSASLAYCMLVSNNEDVPEFESFTKQITDVKLMKDIFDVVANEMQNFFKPSKVDAKKQKGKAGKGSAQKNS